MYHYYQLHYKMHNNINTLKKKIHVLYRFHYSLPPMNKTIFFKPLEFKKKKPFNKKICNNKQQLNHRLSYIDFSCIRTKEGLYLLTPLQHQNFHIDQRVVEKLNRLKTLANWITFSLQLKNFYHSYVNI